MRPGDPGREDLQLVEPDIRRRDDGEDSFLLRLNFCHKCFDELQRNFMNAQEAFNCLFSSQFYPFLQSSFNLFLLNRMFVGEKE